MQSRYELRQHYTPTWRTRPTTRKTIDGFAPLSCRFSVHYFLGFCDICFTGCLGIITPRVVPVAGFAPALALRTSKSRLQIARKRIESSFVVCLSCILGFIVA
jgi:hypothetical protein